MGICNSGPCFVLHLSMEGAVVTKNIAVDVDRESLEECTHAFVSDPNMEEIALTSPETAKVEEANVNLNDHSKDVTK
ncbi:hypothetical protein CEXT_414261 [Caerostris extrusa]|uniref:Uncharacterized protein n=1 Tax=Caerostris extrusa TaxID=172846 RepID=A0AAV4U4N0_CAEEX|nr:hypothetical protein CEXT_414261 [Caerostris extrusa]